MGVFLCFYLQGLFAALTASLPLNYLSPCRPLNHAASSTIFLLAKIKTHVTKSTSQAIASLKPHVRKAPITGGTSEFVSSIFSNAIMLCNALPADIATGTNNKHFRDKVEKAFT